VAAALRREYPTACIDLVASARRAAQTHPEHEYDIETILGSTITEQHKNKMLLDEAIRERARVGQPFQPISHVINWIGDSLALSFS